MPSERELKTIPRKPVYTAGEVATLCRVAPRTVCLWADRGLLRHHRLPCARRDRRFMHDDVIAFMRRHEIPLDGPAADVMIRVLICMDLSMTRTAIAETMPESDGYSIRFARNVYEAGREVSSLLPHVVVVDMNLGRLDAGLIMQGARATADGVIVMALETSITADGMGFDSRVPAGSPPKRVADLVKILTQPEKKRRVARSAKASV